MKLNLMIPKDIKNPPEFTCKHLTPAPWGSTQIHCTSHSWGPYLPLEFCTVLNCDISSPKLFTGLKSSFYLQKDYTPRPAAAV